MLMALFLGSGWNWSDGGSIRQPLCYAISKPCHCRSKWHKMPLHGYTIRRDSSTQFIGAADASSPEAAQALASSLESGVQSIPRHPPCCTQMPSTSAGWVESSKTQHNSSPSVPRSRVGPLQLDARASSVGRRAVPRCATTQEHRNQEDLHF
jgi:hypothetical protein